MRRVLPPLIVGILAVAGWELTVRIGRIAPFILPAPSAILRELLDQRDNVWDAALASGANALAGLVAGTVVALLAALGHHDELAMHVRAALRIGVTKEEIREVLMHVAVYAGVPAANTAFKIAQRTLDASDG